MSILRIHNHGPDVTTFLNCLKGGSAAKLFCPASGRSGSCFRRRRRFCTEFIAAACRCAETFDAAPSSPRPAQASVWQLPATYRISRYFFLYFDNGIVISEKTIVYLGPSGVGVPPAPPRSRGRPTIGPHQRTDLYGLAPVIYNSATTSNQPGSSG